MYSFKFYRKIHKFSGNRFVDVWKITRRAHSVTWSRHICCYMRIVTQMKIVITRSRGCGYTRVTQRGTTQICRMAKLGTEWALCDGARYAISLSSTHALNMTSFTTLKTGLGLLRFRMNTL